MENTYWHKQTKDSPLFEDLLWSRPENKRHAGKLLIVGGDAHSFGVPAEAYAAALDAGIGETRVAMPDCVKKLVPHSMHAMISFVPGVINGSFAKSSLAELLEHAVWADVVLLAGGVGRNSETSSLLERFVDELIGPLVITEDALDLLADKKLLIRNNTVIVAALGQLQKLWPHEAAQVVAHSDTMLQFVEKLHTLSENIQSTIVTVQNQKAVVAHGGQVSTSPLTDEIWRVKTAAKASVWLSQHPERVFEAITSSLIA